jgi:alpha-methylacyl-CoA racemase
MTSRVGQGPLAEVRVIEFPALGPVPFAGMLLADLGAQVIRIDRPEGVDARPPTALERVLTGSDTLARSRQRITLDLKAPQASALVTTLARNADVVLEGFRPGVADRLGIGAAALTAANPQLVYTCVTGWGHIGVLSQVPGHEFTYLSAAGTVAALAPGSVPPLGAVGDLPAGMLAVIGTLAALTERSVSGQGQVVDTSIFDAALLNATIDRFVRTRDGWGPPGTNALDGGSHYYRSYRTSDDRWVSFGAIEAKFHDGMLRGLEIEPASVDQHDSARWPEVSHRIERIIGSEPLQHWVDVFADVETCFAPVLTHEEVAAHPYLGRRMSVVEADGGVAAAPSPQLSRTPPPAPRPVRPAGADTVAVLQAAGLTVEQIGELLRDGVARQATTTPEEEGDGA